MLGGCAQSHGAVPPTTQSVLDIIPNTTQKIKHVVYLKEGRTLGNLFTGWPSAYAPRISSVTGQLKSVKLHEMTYAQDREARRDAGTHGSDCLRRAWQDERL